jgi:hypothetical protein
MNSEYSIELQAENINSSKTKQYFQEVLSSYINGNYRSAIVVLWTVTVYDLVYKLQDLSNIYNDSIAEKILKDLKAKQEANKKSPEWEAELIKLIEERTSMFATYEITHIKLLQEQRHLSAHPLIKEDLDLYQPNKETTRALIRNTLEFVLTKPSMASNKIFINMIEDLNEKRNLFPKVDDLENYIQPKYFAHTPSKVKQFIYKQLWKFVFKLDNEESEKNRKINLKALSILYKNNQTLMNQLMGEEKGYFASNINLDTEIDMKFLVSLCAKFPKIYALLDESHKPPIERRIKQDKSLWSESFFMYSAADDYLEDLANEINTYEASKDRKLSKKIISYCQEHDVIEKLIPLYISQYCASSSYDSADRSFRNLLKEIFHFMSQEDFISLLEGIETNNQTYNRGVASHDHKKLQEVCIEMYDDFDFSPYTNFLESFEK